MCNYNNINSDISISLIQYYSFLKTHFKELKK